MDPCERPRDGVRAAVLPVDCPRRVLNDALTAEFDALLADTDGFEAYVRDALSTTIVDETVAAGTSNYIDVASFAAFTAVRLQFADPFPGTAYAAREPDESAERRMLNRPLWKHPGLSKFCRKARRYYVSTVLWVFNTQLPDALQAEIAACVFAPAVASNTSNRAYADTAPETVHDQYRDRVTVQDGAVHVPSEYASQWCRVEPAEATRFPELHEDLPEINVQHGSVVIPRPVVEVKLAEYAWHGWAKLGHVAYTLLSSARISKLVDATPRITSDVLAPFKRNNAYYTPFYGVDGTENPKRAWRERTDPNITSKPLRIEDKRLITAIDCVRASSRLSFDDPIPIAALFDELTSFFPVPARPGNDVASQDTLQAALEHAASHRITVHDADTDAATVTLPRPEYTPFYPGETVPHVWDAYINARTQHAQFSPLTVVRDPRRGRTRHVIPPTIRTSEARANTAPYQDARDQSHRAAVNTLHTATTVHDVAPFVEPDTVDLTRDELVFVTRIALAMERLLTDYSLTTSMRALRDRSDGTCLQIDTEKLHRRGWVEAHDEGRAALYTVPAAKRETIGVANVAHDGFGEITNREKSVHRKGVDMVAASFAADPAVTRVTRYCDLWRLQATPCEPRLAANDLLDSRIDVIAFAGDTPVAAAGVETISHEPAKPRRCVDKLTALTDTVETSLVVPNHQHLWTTMRQLDTPDYLDLDAFPNSTADTYNRLNWVKKLEHAGCIPRLFDHIHTYRSLDAATLNPTTDTRQHKITGHP